MVTDPIVVPSDPTEADDLLLQLIRSARAEKKNLLLLFNPTNHSATDLIVAIAYRRISREAVRSTRQALRRKMRE